MQIAARGIWRSIVAVWPALLACALLLLSLALFWPGVATYDAVTQYAQALSGRYDDWHPPIMARLWSLLDPADLGGGPMLGLQLLGYWLGLGALALGVDGRRALAILAIGLFPPLLGWQGVIVKDSQMVGALVAASGLVGLYRLRDRPVPVGAWIAVAICLGYATLIRANAVFSTVPLMLLLSRRQWSPFQLGFALLATTTLILAVSPSINQDIFGAADSGVRRSEPLYDLAGIATRASDGAVPGLSPSAVAALDRAHCVKPLFWDPLGETPACTNAIAPLAHRKVSDLYIALAVAAAQHPLAYLSHRLAHLNSSERWLVPWHWPLAAPPARSEPNHLGLRNPASPVAPYWQHLAATIAETPPGWPIFWMVMMIWGLWAALRGPQDPRARLAIALFGSALCQELSFTLISLSSDLRYHLWPIMATALGWALIAGRPTGRRRVQIMGAILAVIMVSGLAARMILPAPPSRYADLLL